MEHAQRSEPSAAAHRPVRAKGYTKRTLVLAFLAGNMVPIALVAAILFWPHHSRSRSSQSKSAWKTIQSIWHRPPSYDGLRSRPLRNRNSDVEKLLQQSKNLARPEKTESRSIPTPARTGTMRVRARDSNGRIRYKYTVQVRLIEAQASDSTRALGESLEKGELYEARVSHISMGTDQLRCEDTYGHWSGRARSPSSLWRGRLKQLLDFHRKFHPDYTLEFGPYIQQVIGNEETDVEESNKREHR